MSLLDRIRGKSGDSTGSGSGTSSVGGAGKPPTDAKSPSGASPSSPAPSSPTGKSLPRKETKPGDLSEKEMAMVDQVKGKAFERIGRYSAPPNLDPAGLRKHYFGVCQELLDKLLDEMGVPVSVKIQTMIIEEILTTLLGFGKIQRLLEDPDISEVMVNGPAHIYYEKKGKLLLSDIIFRDNDEVMNIVSRIVSPLGRRCDTTSPLVDARLPDGSRVNVIIPPLALNGPCLTIRKFSKKPLGMKDLVRFGTISQDMSDFLSACVLARLNIVVSGGTGSGKTTTLNAISSCIPEDERIVTIEDSAELQMQQDHVVSLETRPPNVEGKGEVTIRDLVKNSLRMRPERIVIGECRGGECLDMLQAMNTGHDGSLTTAHANTPADAISRMEVMVLMAGMDLPLRNIREQIASAVDLIIQQTRFHDGSRKITYITEVCGMDGEFAKTRDIFKFQQTGIDEHGKIQGTLLPTGEVPEFLTKIIGEGLTLPEKVFGEGVSVKSLVDKLEAERMEKELADQAVFAELRKQQEAEDAADAEKGPALARPFSFKDALSAPGVSPLAARRQAAVDGKKKPTGIDRSGLITKCMNRYVAKKQFEKGTTGAKEQTREGVGREVLALLDQVEKEDKIAMKHEERKRLVEEMVDDVIGLGPIQRLLEDPDISEVMVNGPEYIYVEKKGCLERVPNRFRDDDHARQIVSRIVSSVGRRCDEQSPIADARLLDGSRVNAVIPPSSLIGPVLTIRKFSKVPLTVAKLVGYGAMTPAMANFLEACVLARLNIVVAGGTGSGKTTTLNALSSFIPHDERVVTIEDAAELKLQQDHVVSLESRPPNQEGTGEVSIRDLVKNSLRMRPERVVIGECRGGECLDMLQAMNTGHDGSLTTAHANSPKDVVRRLETMVMMAGLNIPVRNIREQIASAVHLIVQQSRLKDGSRKIVSVTEVKGMIGDQVQLRHIFEWYQEGIDDKGKIIGQLRPTGLIPSFLMKFKDAGIVLPDDTFGAGVSLDELYKQHEEHQMLEEKEERERLRAMATEPANPGDMLTGKPFSFRELVPDRVEKKEVEWSPSGQGRTGGRFEKKLKPKIDAAAMPDPNSKEREKLEALWEKAFSVLLAEKEYVRRMEAMSAAQDVKGLKSMIRQVVDDEARATKSNLTDKVRAEISDDIYYNVTGFGPIQPLLDREDVSEVMVNARDMVFYESKGRVIRAPILFRDDAHIVHIINKIVSPLGRRCDVISPMVDARLPDGSRVNAIIPPLALKGPCITIRKFSKSPITPDKMVGYGSLTSGMAEFLRACVEISLNIVVSGGTGSGKTTTLNALSSMIPEGERIVTVEDSAELKLQQSHVVSLETRPANMEGKGRIEIRDLIKNCLRMRPDRVVIGECRGGEALDMLQAMNTGHDGSLTTGHANTPRDMMSRIEVMVMMAGTGMPSRAIREQIASAVDLVVQQNRFHDGSRRVTAITYVKGMQGDKIEIEDIFRFEQRGIDPITHKIFGEFVYTGARPPWLIRFRREGVSLPEDVFGPGTSLKDVLDDEDRKSAAGELDEGH